MFTRTVYTWVSRNELHFQINYVDFYNQSDYFKNTRHYGKQTQGCRRKLMSYQVWYIEYNWHFQPSEKSQIDLLAGHVYHFPHDKNNWFYCHLQLIIFLLDKML